MTTAETAARARELLEQLEAGLFANGGALDVAAARIVLVELLYAIAGATARSIPSTLSTVVFDCIAREKASDKRRAPR